MTAQDWNSRYAAAQQWSDEPNALAASRLINVPPGRALDLAAGEGRMTLGSPPAVGGSPPWSGAR